MGPKQSLSKDHIKDNCLHYAAEYPSLNKAADALGLTRSTFKNWVKAARLVQEVTTSKLQMSAVASGELKFPDLPSSDAPIEELIEYRLKRFDRLEKAKKARKLIRVKVNKSGPIGLAPFGDPHLDDDGTNLGLALHHADVVRETDGLYGMNVGDTQNLWVGRLARLYAHQTTTSRDSWRLTEHFLKRVRDWLALVKGNHDHWQGVGDPTEWILRDNGAHLADYDVRICLEFPNGREYVIWMRHDFAGHSMWNNVHGLIKAAKFGARAHLLLAGHKHCCGHHAEYDDHAEIMWHAIRSAGYKMIDEHAENLGYMDSNVFQCPVIIIDPEASNISNLSTVIYDTDLGADILTFMRKKSGN